MDPREKSYQQWKFITALMLALFGLGAAGYAFLCFVGVPMLDPKLVSTSGGRIAVALAVFCGVGSILLFCRE